MRRIILAACCGAACAASPARADVVDASAGGFTIRIVAEASTPPMNVYRALVERIGLWWESSHTFSGRSANVSIDPTAGGCFCERLPNGGTVRHLTVVYADPGKLLRLSGGLGPLQDMAVAGAMSWKLTETSGKTAIELTYKVGGYAPGGLEPLAKVVDSVLTTQLQRLKRFAETGRTD